MELVVISFIGVAATLFALWPVVKGGGERIEAPVWSSGGKRDDLMREKEVALSAIKEIEFDYVSGKLSSEDYVHLNASYENKVIELLKDLDEMEVEDSPPSGRATSAGKCCPRCAAPVKTRYAYCPACGIEIDHRNMGGGK